VLATTTKPVTRLRDLVLVSTALGLLLGPSLASAQPAPELQEAVKR